jgi:Zn-dependent M16 (insulinase) family peptidase
MSHPQFELVKSQRIESLAVDAQEFVHRQTGARHLHFASKNDENVFLVGLKTVPTDNTGVAHILEHTALCGSEKYPVRDPFFMMIRRSLNTFMNAFTSSDWTAYPFASKNKKDFNNLLEVYLDAVFFSRLDEMDFLQEGHRVEFQEPDNADSDLVYKGVVYNEMKGAMSSPTSQLWQMLTRHVFPTSTYHYNSGGDPEHITDLSYEQLKAFYKKHYHPSNAVFMTFGDIPAEEHQAKFHDNVLSRFERSDDLPVVSDEKRYCAPITVIENYPLEESESTEHKTHIVMSWLLGRSFDLESNLEAHLLSNVLFENSAAPLQKALEQTDLGHAPSPMCGLEDSNKEMLFACGIEGSDPDKVAELERLVLSVLDDVAQNGVAQERLEAVLHQLELSQREISGDSYPYGLQLILAGLSPMLHGGDPVALLDLDPVLDRLREQIKDPQYIQKRVQKLLLDNAHRVTLILKPDQGYEKVRHDLMLHELADKKAALSEEGVKEVIAKAAELKKRQESKDDESILPKVGIEDVPVELYSPTSKTLSGSDEQIKITGYEQGTNGLVYTQVIFELPELSAEEQALLPIYTAVTTELGVGDASYLELQNRQSASTGGVHAFTSVKGDIDDVQNVSGVLVYSGKALRRNASELMSLIHDFIRDVRYDEVERIREVVAQMRARREQSVVNGGHSLAMGAASSKLSPSANLSYRLGGLAGIKALKALDDGLKDEQALRDLSNQLSRIHKKVTQMPRQYLVVGEADALEELKSLIGEELLSEPENVSEFSLPPLREQAREAWITNTQVNFCAKAFPSVAVEHSDAPALTVLGGFLRNGYLHRAIREQGGAYGGGASQDSASASFRFFSYRDPRLTETLDDFDASVAWLLETEHDPEQLEQAILGVISQIDKPRSPAGEAKGDFHSLLFGRTKEQRARFREHVLSVTMDDLKRVAQEYLKSEVASVAVVSNAANESVLKELGLEIHEL